jgi:hypothetical protein
VESLEYFGSKIITNRSVKEKITEKCRQILPVRDIFWIWK